MESVTTIIVVAVCIAAMLGLSNQILAVMAGFCALWVIGYWAVWLVATFFWPVFLVVGIIAAFTAYGLLSEEDEANTFDGIASDEKEGV